MIQIQSSNTAVLHKIKTEKLETDNEHKYLTTVRSGHLGDHPAPKQPAVCQAQVQGRGSATQSTGRVT